MNKNMQVNKRRHLQVFYDRQSGKTIYKIPDHVNCRKVGINLQEITGHRYKFPIIANY